VGDPGDRIPWGRLNLISRAGLKKHARSRRQKQGKGGVSWKTPRRRGRRVAAQGLYEESLWKWYFFARRHPTGLPPCECECDGGCLAPFGSLAWFGLTRGSAQLGRTDGSCPTAASFSIFACLGLVPHAPSARTNTPHRTLARPRRKLRCLTAFPFLAITHLPLLPPAYDVMYTTQPSHRHACHDVAFQAR
jgi:hypothetical protein